MGWEIAITPATDAKRRACIIGCKKFLASREMRHEITDDEAAVLIAIFRDAERRVLCKNVEGLIKPPME